MPEFISPAGVVSRRQDGSSRLEVGMSILVTVALVVMSYLGWNMVVAQGEEVQRYAQACVKERVLENPNADMNAVVRDCGVDGGSAASPVPAPAVADAVTAVCPPGGTYSFLDSGMTVIVTAPCPAG